MAFFEYSLSVNKLQVTVFYPGTKLECIYKKNDFFFFCLLGGLTTAYLFLHQSVFSIITIKNVKKLDLNTFNKEEHNLFFPLTQENSFPYVFFYYVHKFESGVYNNSKTPCIS